MVYDITLIKEIGEGLFGKVYLASKKGENTYYSVKMVDKSQYKKDKQYLVEYLNNEINILLDVNHPNILKFNELKETLKNIYIITEYYNGGTLKSFMEKYLESFNKVLSEELVQYIMRQIIEGIKYLHNKKIIHRSICLTNIMINYEDENDLINNNIMKSKIKIIGFLSARYLQKGELIKRVIGVPLTMEPNLIFKANHIQEYGYDENADIWSLGIIFYQLLIGKNPFNDRNLTKLENELKKGDYYIPTTLSKEAISFLN